MELKNRYLSLDVFRGMDVALMILVNTPGNHSTTFSPLLHAHWHGFTLTDLVFPTFLFAVGTSLSFSLGSYQNRPGRAIVKKIIRRTFIIFLLGFLMYWFPFFSANEIGEWSLSPLGKTRIFGVLQRIALCYGLGALIIHFLKIRGALIFSVVALVGYWILMVIYGDFTLTGNAVLRLDTWLLGEEHLYHGESIAFDPEGLLSTLPAIVNVIAGYMAGEFLRKKGPTYETIAKLAMAGAVLIFVGLAWDLVFPINKKLWTSSFVVYTCGIDSLVLAMLIFLIDVLQWKRWTYFFEVFGRNTLFIYLISEVLAILLFTFHYGKENLYRASYRTVFQSWAGDYFASFFFALTFMMLCWAIGYWMDKRKIYVKI